jgi:hypothetical protein
MAGHMNSQKRQINFFELLDSIDAQLDDDFQLYISISYSDDINRELVKERITKYNVFEHTEQKYQFEHYHYLYKNVSIADNDWILFSDDDDYWYPYRTLFYHQTVDKLSNMEKKTKAVRLFNGESSNYIDCMIKGFYFKYFMNQLTPDQMKNKFCDVFFMRFISSYKDK